MGNPTKVLGVRISESLYATLRAVSRARGEDMSDFVRRAVLKELARLSFLTEDEKKALGLSADKDRGL